MSIESLLGIDIGTSSCKVVLLDSSGRTIASASFPYSPRYPQAGWVEQDPEDWYKAAIAAVRTTMNHPAARNRRVVGIGVSGQMISSVFIDSAGHPVRPAILWLDQRSAPQARWLEETAGDRICRITKTPINTAFTLPRLLWVKQEQPEVWAKTCKVLLAKDYLRLRLTGELAIDLSDASGTLLLDSERGVWSETILKLAGISRDLLPPLVRSHHLAGRLNRAAAEAFGLEIGTPVVAGAGDLFSENLAAGNVSSFQRLIRFGSAGSISSPLDMPVEDPHRKCPCYVHCIPNRWLLETSTQAFGLSEWWFKSRFWEGEKDVHELVDRSISLIPPGAEGLFFHPFAQGAPYWNTALRGAFLGINPNHGKSHFARAVLEGATHSLWDALNLLEKAEGGRCSSQFLEWRAVGGGTRSSVWKQIVADMLGVDLLILPEASPAVGAAMLAGIGVGLFNDFDHAISNAAVPQERVTMDPVAHQIYVKLHKEYQQIHLFLTDLYEYLVAERG